MEQDWGYSEYSFQCGVWRDNDPTNDYDDLDQDDYYRDRYNNIGDFEEDIESSNGDSVENSTNKRRIPDDNSSKAQKRSKVKHNTAAHFPLGSDATTIFAPGTVGYMRAMEALHGSFKLDGTSSVEKHEFPAMDYMNPTHYFYAHVLRWDNISDISRSLKIRQKPEIFSSENEYYAYWRHFALEETRSVLQAGLSGKSDTITYKKAGNNRMLALEGIHLTFMRASKNIAVQKLNSQLCIAEFKMESRSSQEKVSQLSKYYGSTQTSFSKSSASRNESSTESAFALLRPGSVFELKIRDSNDDSHMDALPGKILLAALYSGKERNRGLIQLLFCSAVWDGVNHRYKEDKQPWVLFDRACIVSEQRMFVACQERPHVPFLRTILGLPAEDQSSKHLRFLENNHEQSEKEVNQAIPCKATEGSNGANTTHDQHPADVHPLTDFNDDHVMGDQLNVSQKAAVADILNIFNNYDGQRQAKGGVRLVHGPPGCGKTRFLAALLRRAVLKLEGWPFLRFNKEQNMQVGGRVGAASSWKRSKTQRYKGLGDDSAHTEKTSAPAFENLAVLEENEFLPYISQYRSENVDCPCFLVCAPSNKAVLVLMEEYLRNVQRTSLSNSRCCLIGVEDKLCTGSSESANYNQYDFNDYDKNFPPLGGSLSNARMERKTSQKLLYRILYPSVPEDAFVYTLSKRLSEVVWSLLEELDEDRAHMRKPGARPGHGMSEKEVEQLCGDLQFSRSELILCQSSKLNKLSKSLKILRNVIQRLAMHMEQLFVGFSSNNGTEGELFEECKSALSDVSSFFLDSKVRYYAQLCVGESNTKCSTSHSDSDDHSVGELPALSSEEMKRAEKMSDASVAKWCASNPQRDANWGMTHELGTLKKSLLKVYLILQSDQMSRLIVNRALATANMIFCTLTQAGSQTVYRSVCNRVEILFVDEAGQASEAQLLITYNLLPMHVVLVGDPNQLPAFIASELAQHRGCSDSLMARMTTASIRAPCHLLDTQYRMHPEICMLPNRLFYQGKLQDSEWVRSRRKNVIFDTISHNLYRQGRHEVPAFLRSPLAFINVNGNESGGVGGQSISNSAEAVLIARLCLYLQTSCGIDVGRQMYIITFYSAQVALIQSELCKMGLGEKLRSRVSTVDAFQGSESDIVILSFVRSNRSDTVGFVKNMQRLNVSITRSRFLLICVGNAETLRGTSTKAALHPLSTTDNGSETITTALQQLVDDAKSRNIVYDGKMVEQCVKINSFNRTSQVHAPVLRTPTDRLSSAPNQWSGGGRGTAYNGNQRPFSRASSSSGPWGGSGSHRLVTLQTDSNWDTEPSLQSPVKGTPNASYMSHRHVSLEYDQDTRVSTNSPTKGMPNEPYWSHRRVSLDYDQAVEDII